MTLVLLPGYLTATAARAEAHASFLEAQPEPGQRLQRPPKELALRFTEPLNAALTSVELVRASDGAPVETTGEFKDQEILLRPVPRLDTGAFRVDWYTVSTLDGHALEGSFSFGVRADVAGAEQTLEQSPLARNGWLRITARGVMYAAMFFFAGGLMGAALLSPAGRPTAWLLPEALRSTSRGDHALRRAWTRTRATGWVAAGAAAAAVAVETLDASGGLSPQDMSDFLLANTAGVARVGTVVALGAAAALAMRLPLVALGAVALAFGGIAFSGHANAAEPRALAVLTDWIHLLAAAAWVGGIAQIAAAWLPLAPRAGWPERREAMRSVLSRFGRIALPAFLVVAATGLANAVIQLGHLSALWETAYGRVLATKLGAVGAIAAASYWHAARLRPRLLAANPHPANRLERRHWRLLSAEPVLGAITIIAAAVLVAFPLPPRQVEETEGAPDLAACDPCPVPEPKRSELTVAEEAGLEIVALWLEDGGRGTIRTYDLHADPIERRIRIPQGQVRGSCGEGCRRVRMPAERTASDVLVESETGEWRRARLPTDWEPGHTSRARRLVVRAEKEMRSLDRVTIRETVSSGPGASATMTATLRRPRHRKIFEATFRWGAFARSARWLGTVEGNGARLARVAVLDPGTPMWHLLEIDRASGLVLSERLITAAHFIDRRYLRFSGR